jgi:hypothetical protein
MEPGAIIRPALAMVYSKDWELGRTSDASRSMRIDDQQEKKLYDTIEKYRRRGGRLGILKSLFRFRLEAWKAATGESLGHRSGIISNPSKLKSQ